MDAMDAVLPLATLLEEWQHGQDETGRHYGYREEGGDYPWNFLIKMDGRVVAVNTKSRKGTMSLDLPPYDGTPDVTVWIGPIITSYSIRDALNFISFTTGVKGASDTQYKFDTQVQFSELSNSLNRRGNQNVLAVLKPQMCFALTDASFEEFKKNNIPFEKEKKLEIFFNGEKLSKTYRADFLCFDEIIIELKSVNFLHENFSKQLQNYLKATNKKLGILINFGEKSLNYKRIINL